MRATRSQYIAKLQYGVVHGLRERILKLGADHLLFLFRVRQVSHLHCDSRHIARFKDAQGRAFYRMGGERNSNLELRVQNPSQLARSIDVANLGEVPW